MILEKNLHLAHDLDQWAVWFKKEFAPADLDEDGVLAYLHYFADLGILKCIEDSGKWQLSGIEFDPTSEIMRENFLDRLETVSRTTVGFAVNFFLGRRVELPPENPKPKVAGGKTSAKINTDVPANLEPASDLSNLQIVKKVGRQLQPFLEFEKATVSRLLGTHTRQKEARVIFNYILRHTREKAEPKQWEQLSRKRHR